MKRLRYCSNTYRETYSNDIENNDFPYSDYFTNITVEIYEQEYDEDFEIISDLQIGIMEVILYDVESVINNNKSVTDVIDSKSQELSDALSLIFNYKNNRLKDKYRNYEFYENVVYLERLFIKPKFRNLGYAKIIMNQLDKILSRLLTTNFVCMVMLPSAFEYTDPDTYKDLLNDSEIPDGEKLTKNLFKFYQKYGFRPVTGSRALYKICD